MSQTPNTMTIYFIQEQSSSGAWESMGVGYKDEAKASEHVNRITAEKLMAVDYNDTIKGLFEYFEEPEAAAAYADLDKAASVTALLKLEKDHAGALHYAAEELFGEGGGWFSYEDIEITL